MQKKVLFSDIYAVQFSWETPESDFGPGSFQQRGSDPSEGASGEHGGPDGCLLFSVQQKGQPAKWPGGPSEEPEGQQVGGLSAPSSWSDQSCSGKCLTDSVLVLRSTLCCFTHSHTHTHKELLGDYITVSPALTSSLIISRGSIFGNLIRVIISVRTQVFAWADNKNQRRQAAVGKSGSVEPARLLRSELLECFWTRFCRSEIVETHSEEVKLKAVVIFFSFVFCSPNRKISSTAFGR